MVDKKKSKVWVRPSLDDVRYYIKKKAFTFSADAFFSYYENNDWHDSNGNKVKSWKHKCVLWNVNQKKYKQGSFQKKGGRGKPLSDREKKSCGFYR